jgi:hypothetical protein
VPGKKLLSTIISGFQRLTSRLLEHLARAFYQSPAASYNQPMAQGSSEGSLGSNSTGPSSSVPQLKKLPKGVVLGKDGKPFASPFPTLIYHTETPILAAAPAHPSPPGPP